MGKYNVTFDEKAKNITMELSGFFTDNDAMHFVSDFISMSQVVKTEDTYLILDCSRLFLYPCDVAVKLEPVFMLYKEIGYRLVRMRLYPPQKELGRKFKELADNVGLKLELHFADSRLREFGQELKVS